MMPYRIKKVGSKYCVQKKEGDSWKTPSKGYCHSSKKKAIDHLVALKINVEEKKNSYSINADKLVIALSNHIEIAKKLILNKVPIKTIREVIHRGVESDLKAKDS